MRIPFGVSAKWCQAFRAPETARAVAATRDYQALLILHWDFADDRSRKETLIKHGDTVIFSEPAFYEGYERFIEVAQILRNRYGAALRDLVPTKASELYLYGDYSGSPAVVAAARERIFRLDPKGDA